MVGHSFLAGGVAESGGIAGSANPGEFHSKRRGTPYLCSSLTRPNRLGTWPVCPVVWEGRRLEAPPYPDLWLFIPVRSHSDIQPLHPW